MEAILVTTTEGHERVEQSRDRFSQVAKEREDEEPQRKRHRPEGEGWQPLAPPGEGGSSSSGSALPLAPPPPLEPPPFAKRSLEQETQMTDATVEQQGESKRRREHPGVPQAADSSVSGGSSGSTDTETGLVAVCTTLCGNSKVSERDGAAGEREGGPTTLDLTKWFLNVADGRTRCRKFETVVADGITDRF